eukprot:jgi/Ulvmu1/7323/UM035_0112.1
MGRPVSCLLSLRVDFNFSDPCYILQLASSFRHDHKDCLVAAALSNNHIKIINHGLADLQTLCTLEGHSDRITDVSLPIAHSPWLVLSSSEDKLIKLWDTRTSQAAEQYTCTSGELYSCSGSEHIVAGGADGSIWFWDRRQQKVLQRLEDTHMDMVTVCRFHAHRPDIFFSGSDDGLVAAFDFSKGVNEDDAFLAALNIRNSPTQLSFMGPGDSMLWCRTAAETLHLWNWSQSVSEQAGDYMAVEEDPGARPVSCDMMDVREHLNAALRHDLGNFKGQVDYVVSCHHAGTGMFVVAGSNEGSLALFQLRGDDISSVTVGSVVMHLCGGHMDVVRSALFHGEIIITGGEDARVCLWGDPDAVEEQMLQSAYEGAGGAVSAPSLSPPRHKPY